MEKLLSTQIMKKVYKVRNLRRKDHIERELLWSAMLLKNLALVHESRPLSADYLLEELMKATKVLKPLYGDMLTAYRAGKETETFAGLADRTGVQSVSRFALILAKLDSLPPVELTDYLTTFEGSLSEDRMTNHLRRVDRNSFLVTMVATVSVFAVLMNFTVVVVFLRAMAMLSQVFR